MLCYSDYDLFFLLHTIVVCCSPSFHQCRPTLLESASASFHFPAITVSQGTLYYGNEGLQTWAENLIAFEIIATD